MPGRARVCGGGTPGCRQIDANGFSSASMLIPEALMAVGSVALLYGAVRRISGPRAALLAGAALALMPVAALMFRFNNPDAVMVLLMTAAAYCTVRALERNVLEKMKANATVAEWYRMHGRHAVYAKNKDLPLTDFDNPITVVEHDLAAAERANRENGEMPRPKKKALRLPIVPS